MDAEKFNKLFDTLAEEKLVPMGFKKTGLRYYLHQSPALLVFHKNSFRGAFTGFYITLTYDFLSNTKDKKDKLKIPPYLEDYPLSFYASDLPKKYKKFGRVNKFSLTEEEDIHSNQGVFVKVFMPLPKQKDSKAYINSCMDILTYDGIKLLNECTPAVCVDLLQKNKHLFSDTLLNELKGRY
ncbi:MAG: hypothetical protein V4580_19895 [Bacteroidota bacterium]